MSTVRTLNNLEFLCLKMNSSPGKSQRWYRARLYEYVKGASVMGLSETQKGDHYHQYFGRSSKYRGTLWFDGATYKVSDPMPFGLPRRVKSKTCSMFLKPQGAKIAEAALIKLYNIVPTMPTIEMSTPAIVVEAPKQECSQMGFCVDRA